MNKTKAQKIKNVLEIFMKFNDKNNCIFIKEKELAIFLVKRFYQDNTLCFLIDIKDNKDLTGRYIIKVQSNKAVICSFFRFYQ